MPLRFVNPNFHVILIHYPLGVFVLGVFLELFSFLGWRRSSVRTAARWMIVLGALLTLPAALSGIYALHDVQKEQGITDARYAMLRLHVIYMGIATLLAVTCAVVGIGSSDRWRNRLYFPLLLGVVAAWGVMVVGAWHGGETIYQHGTSVALITTEDGKPAIKDLSGEPTPASKSFKNYDDVAEYYIGGELQQHVIMAGFALAVAMGALGLAFRKANEGPHEDDVFVGRAPAPRPPGGEPRRVTDDMSVIRSFNPGTEVGIEPVSAPAGRFWLLTALAVLVTAAMGYWTMAGSESLTKGGWIDFKDEVLKYSGWPPSRHLAHLILGLSFVVLSVVCAFLAWLAPRKQGTLGIFGGLLVLVIAAQVWMGVLLTFDGRGPLTHFKTADEKAAMHKAKKAETSSDSEATPAPAKAQDQPAPAPATQPTSPDTSSAPPADKPSDSK